MKKLVRIMTAVIISVVAALAMTACNEKEYTAVAIGPGHYAGSGLSAYCPTVIEATITVDAKGNVLEIVFDEIFHPLDAATPLATDAAEEEGYIVKIGDKLYYKYLAIGDDLFTIVDNDGVFAGYKGEVNGTVIEFGTASKNANDYLNTQAGAQWYYNAYKNGKLFYAKKTGDIIAATAKKFETTNKAGTDSMRKRDSGYWAEGGGRLGIMANYKALENYILINGFENAKTAWTMPTGDDKVIKDTAGVSTGATMVDTNLYMKVARTAYDKAVAESKA